MNFNTAASLVPVITLIVSNVIFSSCGAKTGLEGPEVLIETDGSSDAGIDVENDSIHPGTWIVTIGEEKTDEVKAIKACSDGDIFIAGDTGSFETGDFDMQVIKLDLQGNIIWQKNIGGTGKDHAESVTENKDGELIIAGKTSSWGAGNDDMWLVKLDMNGSIVWQKTLGNIANDQAYSVATTGDGGIVVAGMLQREFGGGIIKLDNSGRVIWAKNIGLGSKLYSVIEMSDRLIVAVGSIFHDIWIIKLSSRGDLIWQKTIGGIGTERAASAVEGRDGELIVAGITTSFGSGFDDAFIVKLNNNGDIVWQKIIGSDKYDMTKSVIAAGDEEYIIAGEISSFVNGDTDAWVFKLDTYGNIVWQKIIGGTEMDKANSVVHTNDGGFAIAGLTYSFGAGESDMWIIKLDTTGEFIGNCSLIRNSSLASNDSEADIEDVDFMLSDVSVASQDTNAIPQNSNASVTFQCPE